MFLTCPPASMSHFILLFLLNTLFLIMCSPPTLPLAFNPLCVQSWCRVTFPVSGSNPLLPPDSFPLPSSPSLYLLTLLVCLLFLSSQCWVSPWTHAGGCTLTGWHWVKAKPTPAVCQASPSYRPLIAHSLLATWLLTCWWPTWLSHKADTTGHARWSLAPMW